MSSSSSTYRPTRWGILSSILPIFFALALYPTLVASQITLYTARTDTETPTSTDPAAPSASYTGLPAYDPTRLEPPATPQPPINAYTLSLPGTAGSALEQGLALSKPQRGNFLGFSIELSVANNILGKTGGTLKPEFLNYLANIKNRAGDGPIVRVGGNTQDSSTLYVDGFANGDSIEKIKEGQDVYGNAINTPIINFSLDIFYAMSNISSLVGTEWYFGLAFNESDVTQLTGNVPVVAEYAQKILGSYLRGLIVGNEPDLYVDHNHRPQGWTVDNYVSEYNAITQEVLSANVLINTTAFVGPSLCCGVQGFMLQDVLNAGYLSPDNSAHISEITVQSYPTNNCQLSGIINAQDIFANFLNHTSAQSLTQQYYGDIAAVTAAGKNIMMMEMNTASCGGFAGLSDSFGAALWMTDWALQMAFANFTSALMHVGGQNVYYNPFTPPPSTYSSLYQWTTGSVYYPTLVIAEAFGKSGNARVVDMNADEANIYHPAYAIYEGDTPTRVVLFNYITDESGASDLQVTVNLAGAQIAGTVNVRYLRASSVSEQYNITWAGQTMGNSFSSDGRLYGDLETIQIQCTDGSCVIPVPAPSIALVFLTSDALTESSINAEETLSYSTTIIGEGDATVAPGALATGNGQDPNKQGSNSKGSRGSDNAASSRASRLGVTAMALVVVGVAFIGMA